ncbi:protein of unknown function [Pedobacter steynii]|uniref:DUF4468 domain-containing protein n=1 Tax=Pedobacter steynii TaxID=430522 RepID=A0A1H0HQN1_9SPHI|nr:DUF4468 domain-containing protein [Pedobacter steynii]NQX42538.1 DUF4468 domain-containing protein [Pedobacter steynii]SDO21434.1 protein of unknown function [Pedobacter steynii]
MKKQILTLLCVALFPFLSSAQDKASEFTLTSNGFINSADSTKNYVVVDMQGKSQQDLYKKSLIYLSGLYVSPKEVLSTIENESITVNSTAKNAIKMKVLFLNPSWDVNYTITFQFKDGKLRIADPTVNRMYTTTGDVSRTATINPSDGQNNKEIFNRKGVLKEKDGKENLEKLINKFVANYIAGINSAKQDNW